LIYLNVPPQDILAHLPAVAPPDLAAGEQHPVALKEVRVEPSGGVTSCTDPDGLQDSTRPQLLYCTLGVEPGKRNETCSNMPSCIE